MCNMNRRPLAVQRHSAAEQHGSRLPADLSARYGSHKNLFLMLEKASVDAFSNPWRMHYITPKNMH